MPAEDRSEGTVVVLTHADQAGIQRHHPIVMLHLVIDVDDHSGHRGRDGLGADVEISVASYPDPGQAPGDLDDLHELQNTCRAWSLAGGIGDSRLKARWPRMIPWTCPTPVSDRFQAHSRIKAEGARIPHRVVGEDLAETVQLVIVHDVTPQGEDSCYFGGVVAVGFTSSLPLRALRAGSDAAEHGQGLVVGAVGFGVADELGAFDDDFVGVGLGA